MRCGRNARILRSRMRVATRFNNERACAEASARTCEQTYDTLALDNKILRENAPHAVILAARSFRADSSSGGECAAAVYTDSKAAQTPS